MKKESVTVVGEPPGPSPREAKAASATDRDLTES